MTSDLLVDRARQSRSSGAVLKTRVSNLRSKHPRDPIFVFEGPTDLGAYEVWINRIEADFRYVPLAAKGKAQILDLRRRFEVDRGPLLEAVYFFVDRDFDDLRGQRQGPDIFCTTTYSIENYLVTERVLRSILLDEFRCPPEQQDVDNAADVYNNVVRQFAQCMAEANLRIFRANRLMIIGRGVEEAITRYVRIDVFEVERSYLSEGLLQLVRLEREPTPEECAGVDAEFAPLEPMKHYRGKFFLNFFRTWLEHLAIRRKQEPAPLFTECKNIKFDRTTLNLRSLATRSETPSGLREFIQSVNHKESTTAC